MNTSTHTVSVRSNRVDHLGDEVAQLKAWIRTFTLVAVLMVTAIASMVVEHHHLIEEERQHTLELFERLESVRHRARVADAKANHCNTQADDVWHMVQHHHRGQP